MRTDEALTNAAVRWIERRYFALLKRVVRHHRERELQRNLDRWADDGGRVP